MNGNTFSASALWFTSFQRLFSSFSEVEKFKSGTARKKTTQIQKKGRLECNVKKMP